MTTRYVAMPHPPASWCSASHVPEDRPSCIVHEADAEPRDTGLLDAHGVRIFALLERQPIGFRVAPKA